MKFTALFEVELLKCVKNINLPWLFIFSMAPVLINHLFIQFMSYEEFLIRVQSVHGDVNPYNYIFRWFKVLYGYFLMPYFCVFLIWFINLERESKGWKYLISLPVNITNLIYSKIIVITTLLCLSVLLAMIGYLISQHLLSATKPDWGFNKFEACDLDFLVMVFTKVFLSSTLAIIILFIVILIFDNPPVLIASGIILELIKLPFNPFTFHIVAFDVYWDYGKYLNSNFLKSLFDKATVTILLLSSILIFTVKLFRRKIQKEIVHQL